MEDHLYSFAIFAGTMIGFVIGYKLFFDDYFYAYLRRISKW